MKSKLIVTVSLCFILYFNGNAAHATTLRGFVQAYNSYTGLYYPSAGITVQLYCWNGAQWALCGTPAVSGNDGLYYFFNVAPGFNYYVGINGQYYPLYVSNPDYQDVPPIST